MRFIAVIIISMVLASPVSAASIKVNEEACWKVKLLVRLNGLMAAIDLAKQNGYTNAQIAAIQRRCLTADKT